MYGVITIRKAGCQDFTQRISSSNISRGVEVQLDCGSHATINRASSSDPAPAAEGNSGTTATVTDQTNTPSSPTAAESSAKQRLLRIEQLRKEGLITDQEYRTVRQRILDSL
ncbi:MAG: SHOCT domain-containing protein [Candidatus Thiodiazotropha sp.]